MPASTRSYPDWTSRNFGAHMSIAGGHDRAVRAASSLGMTTVQVFTKSNNQWKAKPLTDEQALAFRSAMTEAGLTDPVAHNSYLINLASPDDELWQKSIDAMVVELERAEALGIPTLVSHPGAHVGSGEEAGIARIALGLDEIHRRLPGIKAQVALETTAGQGSCLGHRFEHLRGILDRVRDVDRLGICVDSCHIFAAGYRLGTLDDYNETIGELDRIVGLDRIRAWHLNDSVKALGSRVDRHAGIGRGQLGIEPFGFIVADPRFASLPMILETPKGAEDGEDLDAINLRILRDLEDRARQEVADDRPRGRRAARAS